MNFLERLQASINQRQDGIPFEKIRVNRKDVKDLLYHFDRLDQEARERYRQTKGVRRKNENEIKVQLFDKYPEFAEVIGELDHAIAIHRPMHSAHEGYAVIKEELEELWNEIKKRNPNPDLLRLEASHIAAMGIRFMIDILRHGGKKS